MKNFSTYDLLIIAILAAIGIAIKPVITPLVKLVSSPLMIPGGSLAGGFYMLWMVLAYAIINKSGTALLFGIVQALGIFILGMFGSHGAFSLVTYTLPGVMVEGLALLFGNRRGLGFLMPAAVIANLTGALLMGIIFFQMPLPAVLISSAAAIVSGCLGGWLAWALFHNLKKLKVIE